MYSINSMHTLFLLSLILLVAIRWLALLNGAPMEPGGFIYNVSMVVMLMMYYVWIAKWSTAADLKSAP